MEYIYECCRGNAIVVMVTGTQDGGRRTTFRTRGANQRAKCMHCASYKSCCKPLSRLQLEGELSGNELEEEGGDGEGDAGSLSCRSGLDSELATGTCAGRDGGEHLMDNLSEASDGAWDTDLETDGQH